MKYSVQEIFDFFSEASVYIDKLGDHYEIVYTNCESSDDGDEFEVCIEDKDTYEQYTLDATDLSEIDLSHPNVCLYKLVKIDCK